jgi:diacylglycerol kinase family enzyme
MVILGGGDGTLSKNVDHFLGSDTILAVLPLGTANSFARTLGIPLDLGGAIDMIANGRFHGGIELIESANLESGEIVVQAVEGRSVMRLGWSYLASALKVPARHDTVREFRGPRMRIDTRPKMRVSIDGELGPETPFDVRVVPDAVWVAAPKGG